MELNITNPKDTTKVNTLAVAENVFRKKFNEALVHQVVTASRAFLRAGTRAQKSRSEVSGGGIKPFKQKGTGRARAGTIRSPLWRGGGVTFAAKTANYAQKVNKKMYVGAMRSIMSELVRQERLILVEDFAVATNKTKDLVKKLEELKINQALIITDGLEPNLYLASRNIPNIEVSDVRGINPINLIGFDKVLCTVAALKKIEESLT